jgi:hypothetical protein
MTPCSLVCTNILEELNTSMFRLKDGDNRFLWKVRIAYLTIRCHNQKYKNMNFHRCENQRIFNLSGPTHRPRSASTPYTSRTKCVLVIWWTMKVCLSRAHMSKAIQMSRDGTLYQSCVNFWQDKFRGSTFYHPVIRTRKKTVNNTRSNAAQPAWIACVMRFDNMYTSCTTQHCVHTWKSNDSNKNTHKPIHSPLIFRLLMG